MDFRHDHQALQYEIHSYPNSSTKKFDSAYYFIQILNSNNYNDSSVELRQIFHLSNVTNVNTCFNFCLKQWIKPNAPFGLLSTEPKCHRVFIDLTHDDDTNIDLVCID